MVGEPVTTAAPEMPSTESLSYELARAVIFGHLVSIFHVRSALPGTDEDGRWRNTHVRCTFYGSYGIGMAQFDAQEGIGARLEVAEWMVSLLNSELSLQMHPNTSGADLARAMVGEGFALDSHVREIPRSVEFLETNNFIQMRSANTVVG